MRTNPVKFRATIVLAFVVLLVAVFVIRLIDIQVIQASALTQESVDKRSIPTTVYAKRGQITDKNGTVLADSVMRYNVTVSPKNAKDFLRQTDCSEVTITPQQAAIEIINANGGAVMTQWGPPYFWMGKVFTQPVGVRNTTINALIDKQALLIDPRSNGKNCFGWLSRESGQRRVPDPPHRIRG